MNINCINNNLNNDIVRMKQNKLKNSINRNSYKQEQVQSNIIIKQNNDNDNDYPKRLLYIEGGSYVIESYARRILGPWLRYEDIYIDNDNMNNIVSKITNGGFEEELYRSDLDKYLALKIYGIGMGSETQIINKIKEILPKLRKIRNKDFEFGYRLAISGENINILQRSMTKLPEYKKKKLIPAKRIDINNIINNLKKNDNDNEINSIKDILKNYITRINNSIYDINDIHIFTDGSALLQGNECADASTGIVLLPIINNTNIDNNNNNNNNNNTITKGYKIEDSINTIAITEYALRLRVSNIGGMVTTPFDAELCAGLFAITITNLLSSYIDSNNDDDNIKFSIMTDSRSLCKVLRTMPSINDNSSNNESRYILWKLLLDILKVSKPIDFKWTPGHPERKSNDRNYWSGYDIGIWEADNVAKINVLHCNGDNENKINEINNNINIDKDINGISMLKVCAFVCK